MSRNIKAHCTETEKVLHEGREDSPTLPPQRIRAGQGGNVQGTMGGHTPCGLPHPTGHWAHSRWCPTNAHGTSWWLQNDLSRTEHEEDMPVAERATPGPGIGLWSGQSCTIGGPAAPFPVVPTPRLEARRQPVRGMVI